MQGTESRRACLVIVVCFISGRSFAQQQPSELIMVQKSMDVFQARRKVSESLGDEEAVGAITW